MTYKLFNSQNRSFHTFIGWRYGGIGGCIGCIGCIHSYTHTLIYTHIHSYTLLYTHIHPSLIYTHIHLYTLIYAHTLIHTPIHSYTLLYTPIKLLYTHTHSYTLIYTHIHFYTLNHVPSCTVHLPACEFFFFSIPSIGAPIQGISPPSSMSACDEPLVMVAMVLAFSHHAIWGITCIDVGCV